MRFSRRSWKKQKMMVRTQYTGAAMSSDSSIRKLPRADLLGARQNNSCDRDDETSAESLIMAMKSLPMAGITMRTACGRTIRRIVWASVMPSAAAASRWPRGMAWIPARKISVMYAP